MSLWFLEICAALMFGLWHRNFAAGWYCFFVLELLMRLAVGIATSAGKF